MKVRQNQIETILTLRKKRKMERKSKEKLLRFLNWVYRSSFVLSPYLCICVFPTAYPVRSCMITVNEKDTVDYSINFFRYSRLL